MYRVLQNLCNRVQAEVVMIECLVVCRLLFFYSLQWNLTNPNSLGPELVQISEIFGLMKQYI